MASSCLVTLHFFWVYPTTFLHSKTKIRTGLLCLVSTNLFVLSVEKKHLQLFSWQLQHKDDRPASIISLDQMTPQKLKSVQDEGASKRTTEKWKMTREYTHRLIQTINTPVCALQTKLFLELHAMMQTKCQRYPFAHLQYDWPERAKPREHTHTSTRCPQQEHTYCSAALRSVCDCGHVWKQRRWVKNTLQCWEVC